MAAPTSANGAFRGVSSSEGLELLEGGDTVKIVVGTEPYRVWSLPKKLLVHVSPFFDAALNGYFVETTSNSISLSEDSPAAFENFVQWIYIGRLNPDSMADSLTYVEAWTLGDKLRCLAFQDWAMLQLLLLHRNNFISPMTLQLAYHKSMPGSRLRKWALQEFSCGISSKAYVKMAEEWASVAKVTFDFGSDYITASIKSLGKGFVKPFQVGQQYLGVLVYEDERLDKGT